MSPTHRFQEARSKPRRSPLLNCLTLLTLLTVIVAVAYLANYYNNGAGTRAVTWYAPFDRCQPFKDKCSLSLGRHNPVTLQFEENSSGQLSLRMAAPAAPATARFELVITAHDDSSNATRIQLSHSASLQAYHAEGLPLHCLHVNASWRLSLIEHVPGQRPVGTWYDIHQRCTAFIAMHVHAFDSTVHS